MLESDSTACVGTENATIRISTAGEPLTTPFNPSAFNEGATRLNIDFHVPKYLEDFLLRLDQWAKKTLLEHSARLFKRQVSEAEIDFMYQSSLKKHVKNDSIYPDTFKCKLNTQGIKSCGIWTFDHESRNLAENIRK